MILIAGVAREGSTQSTAQIDSTSVTAASSPQREAPQNWAFSLSAAENIVAQGQNYIQPTFTADRDWLHLEGRYNNEGLNTASLWVGYNLSGGKEVQLAITPLFGVVFGDVRGIAPGYELTLNWHKLQLYSEAEYLLAGINSSDNDFYSTSTLMISPFKGIQIGAIAQRTQISHTNLALDRGPIINFEYGEYDLSFYVLNLDRSDSTYVGSLGISF